MCTCVCVCVCQWVCMSGTVAVAVSVTVSPRVLDCVSRCNIVLAYVCVCVCVCVCVECVCVCAWLGLWQCLSVHACRVSTVVACAAMMHISLTRKRISRIATRT